MADERTDTIQIRLEVPRYLPEGTIALTGARIVTLDEAGVIENGTLVVEGRANCVRGRGRRVERGRHMLIFVDTNR